MNFLYGQCIHGESLNVQCPACNKTAGIRFVNSELAIADSVSDITKQLKAAQAEIARLRKGLEMIANPQPWETLGLHNSAEFARQVLEAKT